MQVHSISKSLPRALKILPVAVTAAISTIALNAKAQNTEEVSKIESDSITAIAKGTVAASNNDTITFEDATNDSIATRMNQESNDILYKTEKEIWKNTKLGFTVEGTGAEVVLNKVLADLSLSSVGTPYAGAYKALTDEKVALERRGADTYEIRQQINALEEMMKDYIRDNQALVLEKIQEEGERTEFHYGKDKSKVGHITQTVSLKGNGGIKDKNSKHTEEANDSTQTNTKNRFDGGVAYGLNIETDNSDVRFDGDFSSDNIDLSLSAETRKKTENGTLSAAASIRETVETGYHEGSGGVSLDYSSNNSDFLTGVLGYYSYAKEKGFEAIWNAEAAAHLKYKNNVWFQVGNEFYPGMNYPYAKLNLTGKKAFQQNDIKLSGRFDTEYGAFLFPKSSDVKPIHNLEVKARGNLVFNPEEDILATLGAGVHYGLQINNNAEQGENKYEHDVAANILGSFKKGKIGISALISLLYNSDAEQSIDDEIKKTSDPVKISSNVTMELEDIFRGITPFVSYTLNTGIQGLEHNVGGGIKLGLEKLQSKKK